MCEIVGLDGLLCIIGLIFVPCKPEVVMHCRLFRQQTTIANTSDF
jgi:hypothetical protein